MIIFSALLKVKKKFTGYDTAKRKTSSHFQNSLRYPIYLNIQFARQFMYEGFSISNKNFQLVAVKAPFRIRIEIYKFFIGALWSFQILLAWNRIKWTLLLLPCACTTWKRKPQDLLTFAHYSVPDRRRSSGFRNLHVSWLLYIFLGLLVYRRVAFFFFPVTVRSNQHRDSKWYVSFVQNTR